MWIDILTDGVVRIITPIFEDIQPSMALTPRDRAKPLRHPFLTRFSAVSEGDHDKIALISLDIL